MTAGARPRATRSSVLALLLGTALVGCGGGGESTPDKPASRAATPTAAMEKTDAVRSGEPVTMRAQPTSVAEPVDSADLAAGFPAVAALPPGPQELVTAALNLEPGPCVPCMETEPRSIARCALDRPPGCENIPELVDRAARLGAAGAWIGPVRAVVAFGDPWAPAAAPEGAAWPVAAPAVPVELWIDLTWGPWQEAVGRAAALVETLEPEAPGVIGVHLRHFPAATVRERPPHERADALAAGVAAAQRQGRALPLLVALAEAVPAGVPTLAQLDAAADTAAGLDRSRWDRDRQTGDSGAVAAMLATDAALAEDLGLRSAPSWRVDGYVLNGHRSLGALLDVSRNELLEHQSTLPAPLLAAPPDSAGSPE